MKSRKFKNVMSGFYFNSYQIKPPNFWDVAIIYIPKSSVWAGELLSLIS